VAILNIVSNIYAGHLSRRQLWRQVDRASPPGSLRCAGASNDRQDLPARRR
jgi:hypothetical protein